jgi:hypothetical protein
MYEKNDYSETPKEFLCYSRMPKLYTSKNLTLGDETPKVMWAPMGKLVRQLPEVITFAHKLHFRCVIARWKGLLER